MKKVFNSLLFLLFFSCSTGKEIDESSQTISVDRPSYKMKEGLKVLEVTKLKVMVYRPKKLYFSILSVMKNILELKVDKPSIEFELIVKSRADYFLAKSFCEGLTLNQVEWAVFNSEKKKIKITDSKWPDLFYKSSQSFRKRDCPIKIGLNESSERKDSHKCFQNFDRIKPSMDFSEAKSIFGRKISTCLSKDTHD